MMSNSEIISVSLRHQRQGVRALLLGDAKKQYEGYKILAETDAESVNFYAA